jgi:hypothetical protein
MARKYRYARYAVYNGTFVIGIRPPGVQDSILEQPAGSVF